jgi:hypothetical protein
MTLGAVTSSTIKHYIDTIAREYLIASGGGISFLKNLGGSSP